MCVYSDIILNKFNLQMQTYDVVIAAVTIHEFGLGRNGNDIDI